MLARQFAMAPESCPFPEVRRRQFGEKSLPCCEHDGRGDSGGTGHQEKTVVDAAITGPWQT